jgi:regulator of sigma E protease
VGYHLTHPSPFAQLAEQFTMIFRTLGSLLNPHSDTGLSKLSSAVGIVHYIHDAAEVGLPLVLMLAVLLNVNLAVLNLLPIPVLDGGQILFATIGRIRGRALPVNLIVTVQSVFFVLIIGMMVYVSVFDVRRWVRDAAAERVMSDK